MTQSMQMVDTDGLVDNLNQPVPPGVRVLQNNMMTALNKYYPKWEGSWLIRIDTRGGIVQVYNTWFTGKMGFVLHIVNIDPEMRKVVEMAGELFERYGIARNRGLNIKQAVQDLKRDRKGEVLHED